MQARNEEGGPEAHPEQQVDRSPAGTEAVGHPQRQQQGGDQGNAEPIDRVGLEDRNHQQRAEVVDDGQRDYEDLECFGDPRTQDGQRTEREGDVGRHRNSPPWAPGPLKLKPA